MRFFLLLASKFTRDGSKQNPYDTGLGLRYGKLPRNERVVSARESYDFEVFMKILWLGKSLRPNVVREAGRIECDIPHPGHIIVPIGPRNQARISLSEMQPPVSAVMRYKLLIFDTTFTLVYLFLMDLLSVNCVIYSAGHIIRPPRLWNF